jgi:hypothetical protein
MLVLDDEIVGMREQEYEVSAMAWSTNSNSFAFATEYEWLPPNDQAQQRRGIGELDVPNDSCPAVCCSA